MNDYNEILRNRWVNTDNAEAFGGQTIFKTNNPEISKNKIANEILPGIQAYQKFRVAKRPKILNPYFVRTKRKVLQSDLIFMRNPKQLVKDNNGYQYILIVQDIFSRKLWAAPLKQKRAVDIKPVLEQILIEMSPFHKDVRLVIDRGTEYLNNNIKNLLHEYGIKITHPSDGHASHVERANLSLQRIIFTFLENETKKKKNWISFLPKALHIINNRRHRIIKMSPNEAELTANKSKVNYAMSIYRHKAMMKERSKTGKKKKPKFEIGDHVRILSHKNKFSRGYTRTFTIEVFQVDKILSHLPITMYTLKDLNNIEIHGNFYPEELSIVKGNVFKIDKILKTAKIRGVKKNFVKWEGYPDSYNSWTSDIRGE